MTDFEPGMTIEGEFEVRRIKGNEITLYSCELEEELHIYLDTELVDKVSVGDIIEGSIKILYGTQ